MQLNKATDYALRVLIHLAQTPHHRHTIAGLSVALGLSENHLMKIVHALGKHGFVTTLRGKGGGLMLARPATEIGLGAVVRAMEDNLAVVECLRDGYPGDCSLTAGCGLKGLLYTAQQAFLATLDARSLHDALPATTRTITVSPARP